MKFTRYLTERVTIKQVKNMAKKYGLNFHKGNGYFYFMHPTKSIEGSIYVYTLNQLTLDEWEQEAKDILEKHK